MLKINMNIYVLIQNIARMRCLPLPFYLLLFLGET